MATLQELEPLCAKYGTARGALAVLIGALEDEVRAVQRKYLARIKSLVGEAKAAREQLAEAIEESKDLFDKPRTRTLHGVKIGYAKGKGRIVWDDEAKVIERIRAQLPKDQVELLVRKTEAVHKPAVYDLVAADLKRLGIRIEGDGDEMVIKDATGDVDKLVEALLAEKEEAA